MIVGGLDTIVLAKIDFLLKTERLHSATMLLVTLISCRDSEETWRLNSNQQKKWNDTSLWQPKTQKILYIAITSIWIS